MDASINISNKFSTAVGSSTCGPQLNKKSASSVTMDEEDTLFPVESSSSVKRNNKKDQFHVLMRSILEIKDQNAIITSNQERIFNILAVHDNSNSFDRTLQKEYSQHYQKFPVKNKDDLDIIEELLKDDSFYQYLSKVISMYGGSDLCTYVKTCLQNLLSNTVGLQITITGKINPYFGNTPKTAMKTLRLFSIICETGRNKFPSDYNEDKVIKTTSSWLRHCKDRLNQKNKL